MRAQNSLEAIPTWIHEIHPMEKRESKNKSKAANRVVVHKTNGRLYSPNDIVRDNRSGNDEDRDNIV